MPARLCEGHPAVCTPLPENMEDFEYQVLKFLYDRRNEYGASPYETGHFLDGKFGDVDQPYRVVIGDLEKRDLISKSPSLVDEAYVRKDDIPQEAFLEYLARGCRYRITNEGVKHYLQLSSSRSKGIEIKNTTKKQNRIAIIRILVAVVLGVVGLVLTYFLRKGT